MIDVARDAEGMRMALAEIFEEDFVRARIEHDAAGKSEATRKRMLARLPLRTLSPGYYAFALHLLALDAEREAGIPLDTARLATYEVSGLRMLLIARRQYESNHPSCFSCGIRQDGRFASQCRACGIKFRKRGK